MKQADETRQRWIVVVGLPIGGIADPARPVAVARFAIDHARVGSANAGFAHQADAKASPDQALDVLAADIVADDLGPLARRSKLRQKDVLDLRTGIVLAEQERLVLEVRPIDDVVGGEPVALWQRDHDAFAPEPHHLPLARNQITGNDGNVEPAGVDAGEEASACALICPDLDLGEPRCILDQAGPKISRRKRGVESDGETAGLAPTHFLGRRGHVIDGFDQVSGRAQYFSPRRGQSNAPAGSLEQHDVQTNFQLRYAAAQGGLLDP